MNKYWTYQTNHENNGSDSSFLSYYFSLKVISNSSLEFEATQPSATISVEFQQYRVCKPSSWWPL